MPSAALRIQGVQPVETHEVVDALHARLSADEQLVDHMGNGDAAAGARRLHAHLVPLRDSEGAESDGSPVWALLREMGTVGASGAADRPSGLVTVRVQLQVSVDPDQMPGARVVDVLSFAHVLAWRALQGGLVDVTDGGGRFATTGQITRDRLPSPTRLDPQTGRLYSSATFAAPVRPLAP